MSAHRAVALRLTQYEVQGLNTFRDAVMAANSVPSWASSYEETPYYYAAKALRAALVDLFGEGLAAEINEDMVDGGESPEYVLRNFYGLVITDAEA